MNATIIFGTKKLGQVSAAHISSEKYPDIPVITVEGQKGAKKSRRILMNSKAAELLGCTVGEIQEIVFASVEMGANAPKQVLIANVATLPSTVDVSYKTSKNKVAYDDSNEKGKAVTSSYACNEIFTFLGLEDSTNLEFQLGVFESKEIEAYSLDAVTGIVPESIETNRGAIATEDVVTETIAEVRRAEAKSPVIPDTVDTVEVVEALTEVEADSDWS